MDILGLSSRPPSHHPSKNSPKGYFGTQIQIIPN
jgi:hypothetical protein